MRTSTTREVRLIEPLRSLRMLHHAAWVAHRWDDPAFPRAFPWFGEARYWEGYLADLLEQLAQIDDPPLLRGVRCGNADLRTCARAAKTRYCASRLACNLRQIHRVARASYVDPQQQHGRLSWRSRPAVGACGSGHDEHGRRCGRQGDAQGGNHPGGCALAQHGGGGDVGQTRLHAAARAGEIRAARAPGGRHSRSRSTSRSCPLTANLDRIYGKVEGEEGLERGRVGASCPGRRSRVEGVPIQHSFKVLPKQDGIYTLTATLSGWTAGGQVSTQAFSIPIIAGRGFPDLPVKPATAPRRRDRGSPAARSRLRASAPGVPEWIPRSLRGIGRGFTRRTADRPV